MLQLLLRDSLVLTRRVVNTGVDPLGQPIDTEDTVDVIIRGKIIRTQAEDRDKFGAATEYLLYAAPDLSGVPTGSKISDGTYVYATTTSVDTTAPAWGPLGQISVCGLRRSEVLS